MGEYEKAIADFTQLSRLEPEAYSYYNLASSLRFVFTGIKRSSY